MTQARVHRKDNSARFKEMERWMDKNLTGEGVGVKGSEGIETSPANNRQVMKVSQAKLFTFALLIGHATSTICVMSLMIS